MIRKWQNGYWWIINTNPGKAPVVYWTGEIRTAADGRIEPVLSFSHEQAAQFETQEQALFNWKMLAAQGFDGAVQAEEHGWVQ